MLYSLTPEMCLNLLGVGVQLTGSCCRAVADASIKAVEAPVEAPIPAATELAQLASCVEHEASADITIVYGVLWCAASITWTNLFNYAERCRDGAHSCMHLPTGTAGCINHGYS